ncbi:Golgi apparatus membrane protein tvp23 [Agyrium rufum]|nr:Golgi apparatus membrane protein tvp23 [Agyrium rufum]
MDQQQREPQQGDLHWRLSSHPVTLITFLAFRISSLLIYLFGGLFIRNNFILVFILTITLLSIDFYYLKNIAGRRLVGLRWWNEVKGDNSGDSHWVFESSEPGSRVQNKTDSRFFWLALYVQPALWVGLALFAVLKLEVFWLSLIVIALILTVTNTLAFSRCDKFGQASNLASSALYSGGIARNLAGGMFSRMFSR